MEAPHPDRRGTSREKPGTSRPGEDYLLVSRPLVYLTLALAAGIALPVLAGLPPAIFRTPAVAVTLISAAVFFALRKNVFWALLPAFFLIGGVLSPSTGAEREGLWEGLAGGQVTIEGYICGEPDIRADRTVYPVEVESVYRDEGTARGGGRVLIYIPGRPGGLGYGDAVRVRGKPYLPDRPGNPGQPDYREYLSGRGISALISVKDGEGLEKTGSGRGSAAAGAALGLKERLMEVNRATLDPGQAALVNGIVFGARGEIDRRTAEVFNEAGVVHILSVSGLHVGLVAAGFMGIMGMMGLQRASFPGLTLVLAIYAYITGMGPAVIRSSVMAWIQLLGHRLGRDRDWPSTLAASALIILIFSPRSLFEPGFQLSFAATWGILHLGPPIDRLMARVGVTSPWARGCLWVSLAAQAGTFPLIAYYYNIFSLVAIPANILAVPLVGLILPLGLAAPLAGLVWVKLALMINWATAALLDLMMLVVGLVHSIPGGVVYVGPPHPASMAAWYVSLALLAGTAGAPKKLAAGLRIFCAVLLAAALGAWALSAAGQGRGDLQLHVIDVGQGDSILARFPNGRVMLVDSGGWKGEFENGWGAGQVVASYLRRQGIRRLDALVLTHPHEDHAAGAGFLLGRFDIGTVLVPPAGPGGGAGEVEDPAYRRTLALAGEKSIPVRELYSGDSLALDPGVRVEVLGPGADLISGTRSDLNNNSLVLSLRYGEKSFLLTGDIESEGQARLMERGAYLGHSVLKVPHHGSRYVLPGFIDRVGPDLSVISVGRNAFGQPDPATLKLAGAEGRPVYRTDRDGLVVLYCDGRQIRVSAGKKSN